MHIQPYSNSYRNGQKWTSQGHEHSFSPHSTLCLFLVFIQSQSIPLSAASFLCQAKKKANLGKVQKKTFCGSPSLSGSHRGSCWFCCPMIGRQSQIAFPFLLPSSIKSGIGNMGHYIPCPGLILENHHGSVFSHGKLTRILSQNFCPYVDSSPFHLLLYMLERTGMIHPLISTSEMSGATNEEQWSVLGQGLATGG